MKSPNPQIEEYRIRQGPYASNAHDGNNGAFEILGCPQRHGWRHVLLCIVSDAGGWEHVSVTTYRKRRKGQGWLSTQPKRCPTWNEMVLVKNLFWRAEECVIQYHPPDGLNVNNHEFCLHLWKAIDQEIPMPPPIMVGIPGLKGCDLARKPIKKVP